MIDRLYGIIAMAKFAHVRHTLIQKIFIIWRDKRMMQLCIWCNLYWNFGIEKNVSFPKMASSVANAASYVLNVSSSGKSLVADSREQFFQSSVNFERTFWYPWILPKHEWTNWFLELLGKKTRTLSFIFWKNLRLERNIATLSKI